MYDIEFTETSATEVDLNEDVELTKSTDTTEAIKKIVPLNAVYADVNKIHGKTIVWNQLVGSSTTTVTVPSGHKYRFYDKNGTDTIGTSSGASFAVTGGDDMVFDLTQMFGSGNEPSTVAEFKAMFPLDYYAYDSGSLLSYTGTGIKTVGFNQWDEVWEAGGYNSSGEKYAVSNSIRSANFIPVLPSTTYYFKAPKNPNNGINFYDASQNFISLTWLSDSMFTTPSNCHYVTFDQSGYGTTYNNDICINLSWSGYRNGEYEPYWTRTLSLPISTYFPNGMRSAGSVYDELTKSKAVTRIGAVDLGTLNWAFATSTRLRAIIPNDMKIVADFEKPNWSCASREPAPNSINLDNAHNAICMIRMGTLNVLYCYGISLSDAPTGYLYYELATYTEQSISSVLTPIPVEAAGTMEFLQSQTPALPIVSEIDYLLMESEEE